MPRLSTYVAGSPGPSIATVFAAILVALGIVAVGFVGPAAAQTTQPPPVETFGDAYPPPLPPDCTVTTDGLPGGEAVMVGEAVTVNGAPVAVSSRNIGGALVEGDSVNVSWEALAAGCDQLGFSLSLKATQQLTGFNPNDLQELVDYVYCGPGGPSCADTGNSLTFVMPAQVDVPCWQLDFVIGAPLSIVGPGGDFYRFNQPIDMLIASKNGGVAPCTAPPCPTNPDIIAAAFRCREPLPPDAIPPTPQPSTTVPVSVGGVTVTNVDIGLNSIVLNNQPDDQLAISGRTHGFVLVLGALCLMVGTTLAWGTRRPKGAHYRR